MKSFIFFLFCFPLFASNLAVFDYEKTNHIIELKIKKEKCKKIIYEGKLKVLDPINGNNLIIPFEYYRIKSDKKLPLAFVYPSVADEIPPIVERLISNKLSNNGYHAIITNLVEDIADTNRPVEKIDDFLIRSTIAFRHLVDQFELRDEVDADKLFAVGTSLGGIRAALSLSAEPRLKKAFVYVAGANLPEVMTHSTVGLIEKYKEAKKKELGLKSDQEYLEVLKKNIKIDPLDFAQYRSNQEIYMVLATKDVKVPYKNQLELLEAFNHPEHEKVRGGHRLVGSQFLYKKKNLLQFFND